MANHSLFSMIIAGIAIFYVDGRQSCVDTVNVRQKGSDAASTDTQVIVPNYNFSCNGRITGYLISLEPASSSGDYPIVQVWRPNSIGSTVYTRVDTECALTASDINRMTSGGDDYYLGNVSCNGSNRIEFQLGDVIGYYHSSGVRYRLWNIGTSGYTSYSRDENSPPDTFNTNNVDGTETHQPLIEVLYGKSTYV